MDRNPPKRPGSPTAVTAYAQALHLRMQTPALLPAIPALEAFSCHPPDCSVLVRLKLDRGLKERVQPRALKRLSRYPPRGYRIRWPRNASVAESLAGEVGGVASPALPSAGDFPSGVTGERATPRGSAGPRPRREPSVPAQHALEGRVAPKVRGLGKSRARP